MLQITWKLNLQVCSTLKCMVILIEIWFLTNKSGVTQAAHIFFIKSLFEGF